MLRKPRMVNLDRRRRFWRCNIAAMMAVLRREPRTKTAAPSFLQKDVEEGVVNPNLAVIFDEPQFSEAIHEKTHSGPGGANHLSQYLLADLGNHRLRFALLAELREQQQNPRQALFA